MIYVFIAVRENNDLTAGSWREQGKSKIERLRHIRGTDRSAMGNGLWRGSFTRARYKIWILPKCSNRDIIRLSFVIQGLLNKFEFLFSLVVPNGT